MRPLILVVEDEALVRMTLVDVLEDAGFKVIEAVNAYEALRVLKAVSDVQAVVTDVEMPQGSINGFELAHRVRTNCQGIGVLVVSGRAALKAGDLPDGALFIGKLCPSGDIGPAAQDAPKPASAIKHLFCWLSVFRISHEPVADHGNGGKQG
jgi:CheY-like chemotaxis protein